MRDKSGLAQSRRAAIAVALLGIYLEAVEWIDLYSWNDIRHGNGQDATDYIIAAVIAVLAIWLWIGGRIPALLSTALIGFWGYLQITTWWIPYFAGASPGWKKVYAKWFAGCTQILPATPDHLPPDANHLVLHILIAVAFVLSVSAAIASFRRA